jgi:hypothetical protein
MTTNPTPIDISSNLELLRLAEEVEATKTPRKLTRDRKTVAILMPVTASGTGKKKRAKTKVDYAAFRGAFGSWNNVDTKALLNDIYADLTDL